MDASGEICPGCSSMYTGACNLARIIPGCSHNLCEKCILTDGTNTGQVACRSPGCSTATPWTNRPDQFVPNMLILGTETYRQLCLSQAPVPGNNVEVLENVNHEIVDVTGSSQPQDDKCDIMCGECEESTADCLCQTCHSFLCSHCFHEIHKMAKSLMSHKSLPIVTDCDGQKMEEKVKLSNCTDHDKKIEYVAEGGEVGCAQCFLFGKLKGLNATNIVSYNKNIKKDLREKIDEGKGKIERLKSVLSGLEEERAIKEDISSEDLTKEIRYHFSECHSQLQTLQHQLCQRLQKHQIELTAWQRNIDFLIKSTASKIDEATNVLQFSEKAVSNDAVLDIFNFNEILSLFAVLDDEASEDIEQTRPDSCTLAIEAGFKHHLRSHITLKKSDPSSVSHPTGASSPLASSTFLTPHYSGSSPPPSPVVSSTSMALDFSGRSPPPPIAPLVSISPGVLRLLKCEPPLSPPSPKHCHQQLQPPLSPPSPKVCHQQLQQLEIVSHLEIQQPEAVLQQEIQQPLQVCQQQLQDQQHLSASSTFSLEHPPPTTKTVCVSYQDGNKSTPSIDVSKKEKHEKSPRGRYSGVLRSKSWKKSTTVNVKKKFNRKKPPPKKICQSERGDARQSSPVDWNSVLKKSILKIKAQKLAPNLKRIYERVTRDHRNLKLTSDDIVKKLDEAVEKGVLERIVKDEKLIFQITRSKLLSTPSASPLGSPLRSDGAGAGEEEEEEEGAGEGEGEEEEGAGEGAGLNASALGELDSDDFGAMVGLQKEVNV